MKKTVIEIVKVKLKRGISEEQYMIQGKKVHERFLCKQPGFQKRITLKSSKEEWADLVWWDSLLDAQAASEKLMKEPSSFCLAWMQMMDETSVDMWHGEIVQDYHIN